MCNKRVEFGRQIVCVLKMDASVPVDRKVSIPKRPLRKYVVDSGFTDVVKTGGRSFMLRHGKVLVEAIAAKI